MDKKEQLELLQKAEEVVLATERALKLAREELRTVRAAAVQAADLGDFPACWELYHALKDSDAQASLKNRIGRHLFPFTAKGKLFALAANSWKPEAAHIAGRIEYGISDAGISAWVHFKLATKGWEENEAVKWGNPSAKIAEMPAERTKADFEWDAKNKCWALKASAGKEVSHV